MFVPTGLYLVTVPPGADLTLDADIWTDIGEMVNETVFGGEEKTSASLKVPTSDRNGLSQSDENKGSERFTGSNQRPTGGGLLPRPNEVCAGTEDGQLKLKEKGKTSSFVCSEVAPAESGAILDAYKVKAGRAVAGYFKQLPSAADHPVFRLS